MGNCDKKRTNKAYKNYFSNKTKKILTIIVCLIVSIGIMLSIGYFAKVKRENPMKVDINLNMPIEYVGTKITDEQIKTTIKENANTIATNIATVLELKDEKVCIALWGYGHITLGSNKNTVVQNHVTIPVTVNDNIAATVSIYTYKNDIVWDINVGGTALKKLNTLIKSSPHGELAMVYIDDLIETVIKQYSNGS